MILNSPINLCKENSKSDKEQWEYRYKKDIILAKAASQQGDLILTQMDYNLRKAFFKERYNFFAEKFGIKG